MKLLCLCKVQHSKYETGVKLSRVTSSYSKYVGRGTCFDSFAINTLCIVVSYFSMF